MLVASPWSLQAAQYHHVHYLFLLKHHVISMQFVLFVEKRRPRQAPHILSTMT